MNGNMPATAASKHTTKSTNGRVPTVATYMVLVAPPWGGIQPRPAVLLPLGQRVSLVYRTAKRTVACTAAAVVPAAMAPAAADTFQLHTATSIFLKAATQQAHETLVHPRKRRKCAKASYKGQGFF